MVVPTWKYFFASCAATKLASSLLVMATKISALSASAFFKVRTLVPVSYTHLDVYKRQYTAGAICSIAYEKPVPAVDGNVLRVVSRMLGLSEDVSKQTVKKQVGAWLEEIFPPHHAGDFTLSLIHI